MTQPTFESFQTLENNTLEHAKKFLSGLTRVLIERDGILGQPVIVGIQGDPGVGKTHLIKSLRSGLDSAGINYLSTSENEFLLSVDQKYKKKDNFIVIADDLFQKYSSLDQCSKQDLVWLGELIYELYERNGILIVTSNFDIRDIFQRVSATDDVGRLKSRCDQLLGSVTPIHIQAEDYRKKLAQTSGGIKDLMADIMGGKTSSSPDGGNKVTLIESDIESLNDNDIANFFSLADKYLRNGGMSVSLKEVLAKVYFKDRQRITENDFKDVEFNSIRRGLLKKYFHKEECLRILNKSGEVLEKWLGIKF